jgi:hypothetical protein
MTIKMLRDDTFPRNPEFTQRHISEDDILHTTDIFNHVQISIKNNSSRKIAFHATLPPLEYFHPGPAYKYDPESYEPRWMETGLNL